MPAISMFYGVIVRMYYFDTQQHDTPHIHVVYQGKTAVVEIPSGRFLEQSLPANKARLVRAWIEIHKDELMANWQLALGGEPVFKTPFEISMNPTVTKVEPLENHKLKIEFANGDARVFDVAPYLDKGIFTQLKDEQYFRKVRVAFGSIAWPNDQDFSKDTLYLLGKPV